jgi:sugar/nucleoside kinase (ribokinase family)
MSDLDPGLDLMLLGHVAKDRVVVVGQAPQELVGGAVYFGAFAARASGCSCQVVTKLHPDDLHLLEPLTHEGIQVHCRPCESTAGITNTYSQQDQERRTCELLSASQPFTLEDLPGHRTKILHVGALLAGQVPEALIPTLAQRAALGLGLDLQGFVRVSEGQRLILRPWPDAERVLGHVSFLKADAAEAEVVTGELDLERAARALVSLGRQPAVLRREVVLTHSSMVVVAAETDGGLDIHSAPLKPKSLRGRTGRGDTCMAAYLAARVQGNDPGWATRYAAALTSLKLEREGPFRGTRQEVLERLTPC